MAEQRIGRSRRSWTGRLLAQLTTTALIGASLMTIGVMSGYAADPTVETAGGIGTYHWQPSSTEIGSGGSVTFKNMEAIPHSVVFETGPESPSCTGVPTEGATNWSGSCTFAQAGEYKFHCAVHPLEMKGTITVTGGGPSVPVVSTGTATNVTDTGATLAGTVNPSGQATMFRFEYGTTTSYGETTAEESAGEGTIAVSNTATITGLQPGTTYHFQITASNETGPSAGVDHTFTTTGPPTATTLPATAIGGTEASLAGSVNPGGHATTYYFKYGTTTTYTQETAHKPINAGTTAIPVAEHLTTLTPETTYHFQLVAESTAGTVMGVDKEFKTFGEPTATTTAATGLSDTGATLGGTVNPRGQGTAYYFEYGLTDSYGQKSAEKTLSSGTSDVAVSAVVPGLAPETTYHFLVVAKNSAGTVKGLDATFTTEATPPPPPPPPPTPTPNPPPPPPEVSPPDTKITVKPGATTSDSTPTIKFTSTPAGAAFMCSVDSKAFKACRSPFTAPALKPGRHKIRVEATLNGATDATPASYSFKVLAKKKKKR